MRNELFDPATPVSRPTPQPAQPPWRVLALLAGAAALLHALLLAGVTAAETGGGGAQPAVALQVRTLPAPKTAPPDAGAAAPAVDAAAGVDAKASADTSTATPTASDAAVHRAPQAGPPAPFAARKRVAAGARPMRVDAADSAASAAGGILAEPGAGGAVQPPEPPEPPASSVPPARAADVALADAATPPLPVAAAPASAQLAEPARRAGTAAVLAAAGAAATAHGAGASDADGPGTDLPAAHEDEIPVYKTVIPPPLTLHYDLRRGLLSGSGTLSWRPQADHYEMRLEGRVAGLSVLTQVSRGGFDDAGLAPSRYTDQRLNRAALAANFNREQGRITFSGPSAEFPLLVGTQDRLSWMIQLAAVVSAEPRRLSPGGKVAIYVVGARADASVWVFRCAGMETVETAGGTVHAARFTREPRSPHDTLAEAWLDPARHGLPVRARVGTGDGGDAVELSLRDLQLP